MSQGPMSRLATYPLVVPRHACSPHDHVRAGDVWRLVQEAAVLDSAACAWPPSRYRADNAGFVVRSLFGVHHRPLSWGEAVGADTWIQHARRDMVFDRRTNIFVKHGDTSHVVLSADVSWVYVSEAAPARAPSALVENFGLFEGPPMPLVLPGEPDPERLPDHVLTPSFVEMDPQGHTNHPRYVDWADEAISRWLYRRGVDPHGLRPHVDRVRYRLGAVATDNVRVVLSRTHRLPNGARFKARFVRQDEALLAEAEVDRTHIEGGHLL